MSFIMALPEAFLISKNFLLKFNFHTSMPVRAFLAGPVIEFAVASLTVSSQACSVAKQNPVKALRYE
jgi:hypothetical protein